MKFILLKKLFQHCRIYLCGTKKDLIDNDTRTRAVPQNEAGIIAQGTYFNIKTVLNIIAMELPEK